MPDQQQWHGQQWEYNLVELLPASQGANVRLNELGAEGWEFVLLIPEDRTARWLFRRPKLQARGPFA